MKIKHYLMITATLLVLPSISFPVTSMADDSFDSGDILDEIEESSAERQKRVEEIRKELERLTKEDDAQKKVVRTEITKARESRQKMIEENQKKEGEMQAALEAFKKKASDANANTEDLKKEFTDLMVKLKKMANASGYIIKNYEDLGKFWDQRTGKLLKGYNSATESYVEKIDALLNNDNHDTQRDFLNTKKSMKKSRKKK